MVPYLEVPGPELAGAAGLEGAGLLLLLKPKELAD